MPLGAWGDSSLRRRRSNIIPTSPATDRTAHTLDSHRGENSYIRYETATEWPSYEFWFELKWPKSSGYSKIDGDLVDLNIRRLTCCAYLYFILLRLNFNLRTVVSKSVVLYLCFNLDWKVWLDKWYGTTNKEVLRSKLQQSGCTTVSVCRLCVFPNDKFVNNFSYNIPSNETIQKVWLGRIQNPMFANLPFNKVINYFVCAAHFHSSCIDAAGKLKRYSLPTINVSGKINII